MEDGVSAESETTEEATPLTTEQQQALKIEELTKELKVGLSCYLL